MKATELARMKNIDISIGEYNNDVNTLNDEGFIDTSDPSVKKLQSKYESLIARLDTNIHIKKKDGKYIIGHELFNTSIKGMRGLSKTVKIESET